MTDIVQKWITVQIRSEALWINFGINLVCYFDSNYSCCL